MLLKVVTWPMGFIILARGEKKVFFWTEILTNAGYVALVWAGVGTLGLRGTGVAFAILYAINCLAVYWIVRRLTGFRWSAANKQLGILLAPVVTLLFIAWYFLPLSVALAAGAAVTIAAGLYSLRLLCRLIPADRLPRPALKMFRILKLMPSNTH